MDDIRRNEEIAEQICVDRKWHGQQFDIGDCVALLDGRIVTVAGSLDDALRALREADPDPRRGMVFEVALPVMDMVR